MKIIEKIRKKFYDKEYEFAIPHFFEEMADDELEFSDIERVIKTGKIRNKFTHDPRGTRYEIVGCSHDEREVAVICRIKTTAILILANLGATTESCPYKYGKYLPIIGDFMDVGAGLRARPFKISFS